MGQFIGLRDLVPLPSLRSDFFSAAPSVVLSTTWDVGGTIPLFSVEGIYWDPTVLSQICQLLLKKHHILFLV